MANFLGFKQVTLAQYNALTVDEKKHYLWLVRELSGETVLSAAIYFGTRKYAEVNKDSEDLTTKINNIIESLGNAVDEDGAFVGFLPDTEHEILSGVSDFTEAISALESAILNRVDADTFNAKVEELEEKIENAGKIKDVTVNGESVVNLSGVAEITLEEYAKVDDLTGVTEEVKAVKEDVAAVKEQISDIEEEIDKKAEKEALEGVENKLDSAITEFTQAVEDIQDELDKKANASDVYSKDETYNKEEIDSKVAGAFRFKGEAEEISEDETKIKVNGEWITANSGNTGDVYQIGEFEYASNGEKWVKLGFNIDLSEYAKKTYVDTAVSGLNEEIKLVESGLIKVIEETIPAIEEEIKTINEEVGALSATSTLSAATYEEAEEMAANMALGQIIYVAAGSTTDSGKTSGAYIKYTSGLAKLEATQGGGASVEDRVSELENRLGAEPLPEGETTIIGAINTLFEHLHDEIGGDDIEE